MDFQKEIQKFINKIEKGEHFALIRIGDGEKMLMNNQAFTGQARVQDKRKSEGKETKLGNDLKKTLNVVDKDFYYGISCRCCNSIVKQRSIDNIKSKNFTYANLRINGNYKTFKKRIEHTRKSFYVICNWEGYNRQFPFNVYEKEFVPNNCVNFYEEKREEIIQAVKEIAKKENNQTFLISAGPLAKVFIYEMWKVNKNNTYIDVGSAIDEYVHGRVTRGYVRENDMYSNKICVF